MKSEIVEYEVMQHFIPSLINGDVSGLNDDEINDLESFEQEANEFAKSRRAGFVSCHWSCNDESTDNFGRCEITQCFGDRGTLQLVIMFDE